MALVAEEVIGVAASVPADHHAPELAEAIAALRRQATCVVRLAHREIGFLDLARDVPEEDS